MRRRAPPWRAKKQAEAEQAAAAEVDLPIIKKKKPPGAEGKQQAPRQEGAGFSGRSQPPPAAQQGGFFSRLGVGGGRPKSGSPKEDPPGAPPSGNRSINPFKIGLPSYIDNAARAFSEVDPRDEGEWDDWATQEDKDWDGPETPYMTRESYEQRRRQAWAAKKGEGTPRDVFLRPMVDLKGAQDRLGFNSTKVALEIEDEFDENRWESQEALKYAGFLIGVPLLVGFTVSRLLADPFYELVMAINPDSFALSDKSKVEGAQEVHIHEMRLRMDAATGRAPPISEEELQRELRKEAKHIAKEFRERNRRAMLNVLSDGTTATVGFGILSRKTEGRDHLFRSLSRFTSGLSDTAKAFLIIAGTDILLGYHSEEGWTAALRLLGNHWGMEPEDAPIYIFVAIVPVTMDAIFKYWIFKGLNRQNPAAAATLRSMDRH